MNNEISVKEKLELINASEGNQVEFDETAITNEYRKNEGNQAGLVIKVLSIMGGLLATMAFIGFLFIAGLYDSDLGLLLFGIGFISGAIALNRAYDKLIIDTVSISSYVVGFVLLVFASSLLQVDENMISLLFIAIALVSLAITQNYILSLTAVLVINGSLLSLVIINDAYNLIHLYISLITILLTFYTLYEARIITSGKKLSRLYNPVRIGLVVSLVGGLICVGKKGLLPLAPNYIWMSSVVIIPVVLYLIPIILNVIRVNTAGTRVKVYLASIILLLPMVFAPAISGAILILLLSYLVNHKTGIAVGIISVVYFISQFYYDLNLILLVKSGILFSSGILFILFYLLTYKKLGANEEV